MINFNKNFILIGIILAFNFSSNILAKSANYAFGLTKNFRIQDLSKEEDNTVINFDSLSKDICQYYNNALKYKNTTNESQITGISIIQDIQKKISDLEGLIRTKNTTSLEDKNNTENKRIQEYQKYLSYIPIAENQVATWSPIDKELNAYKYAEQEREVKQYIQRFKREIFSKIYSYPEDIFKLFTLKAELILMESTDIFGFLPNKNLSGFQQKEAYINDQISSMVEEFSFLKGGEFGSYSNSQIKDISDKIFIYLSSVYGSEWKDEEKENLKTHLYVGIYFLNKALLGINVSKVEYFPVLIELENFSELPSFLPGEDTMNPKYAYVADCINLAYGRSTFNDKDTCRPRDFFIKVQSYMDSYRILVEASVSELVFEKLYNYAKYTIYTFLNNRENIENVIDDAVKPNSVSKLKPEVFSFLQKCLKKYFEIYPMDMSISVDNYFKDTLYPNLHKFYVELEKNSSLIDLRKVKIEVENNFIDDLSNQYNFNYYYALKRLRNLFINNVISTFLLHHNIDIDPNNDIKIEYSDDPKKNSGNPFDDEKVLSILNTINNNIDKIPETLTTVSLGMCSSNHTDDYWTKTMKYTPTKIRSNGLTEDLYVEFTGNVEDFDYRVNSASPITAINMPNITEVVHSKSFYTRDDGADEKLFRHGLFQALAPIYSNYVQLSMLLEKDYALLNSNVSPEFPSFELIRKSSERNFFHNLRKRKDLIREELIENNGEILGWKMVESDEKTGAEIISEDKDKKARIRLAKENYKKNLDDARSKIAKIDNRIREIELTGKNLDSIITRKGLSYEKIHGDTNMNTEFYNLINQFKLRYGLLNFESYESVDQALEKALKNYIRKAYPNDDDYNREIAIRQRAKDQGKDAYTREEILYAWFYYLFKKVTGNTFFTIDNYKKFIKSEVSTGERYLYDIFGTEGVIIYFLALDLKTHGQYFNRWIDSGRQPSVGRLEEQAGIKQYNNSVTTFAEYSKEVLGLKNKEHVHVVTPLEEASGFWYTKGSVISWCDQPRETVIRYNYRTHRSTTEKATSQNMCRRPYNPAYLNLEGFKYELGRNGYSSKYNSIIADIIKAVDSFYENEVSERARKLGRVLLIEIPMDIEYLDIENSNYISTLKHIKDVLYFTYLPLYFYKNSKDIKNKKDFDTVDVSEILDEYRQFLERQLITYAQYISSSDIKSVLKNTFGPNLVLMRSILEKHPILQGPVCYYKDALINSRYTQDMVMDGFMLVATAAAMIPSPAQGLAGLLLLGLSVTDIVIQGMRIDYNYQIPQDALDLSMVMVNHERMDVFTYNNDLVELLRSQFNSQTLYSGIRIGLDAIIAVGCIKPVYTFTKGVVTSVWKDYTKAVAKLEARRVISNTAMKIATNAFKPVSPLSSMFDEAFNSIFLEKLFLQFYYTREIFIRLGLFQSMGDTVKAITTVGKGFCKGSLYVMWRIAPRTILKNGFKALGKVEHFWKSMFKVSMDGIFIWISLNGLKDLSKTGEVTYHNALFDIPMLTGWVLPSHVIIAVDILWNCGAATIDLINALFGTYKKEIITHTIDKYFTPEVVERIYQISKAEDGNTTQRIKYDKGSWIDINYNDALYRLYKANCIGKNCVYNILSDEDIIKISEDLNKLNIKYENIDSSISNLETSIQKLKSEIDNKVDTVVKSNSNDINTPEVAVTLIKQHYVNTLTVYKNTLERVKQVKSSQSSDVNNVQ